MNRKSYSQKTAYFRIEKYNMRKRNAVYTWQTQTSLLQKIIWKQAY